MQFINDILSLAWGLILGFDSKVFEIVWLSLKVSLTSLLLSCFFAIPLGIILGVYKFYTRNFVILILNH